MPASQIAEKIKPTLAFLLAWAFLNVLMNIKYPAQQLHVLTLFKISPEVLGIMMIPLATAAMGLRFHPALYLPLTAFSVFLRLFRIGDILVPMYFFRPFNLFLDAQFVPDLIHLLYTTISLKTFAFATILTVILLTGASYTESAEDLQEYLESNGVRAKISDNYTRYLFSHRVVIFGSRVPLTLGTSYGATAFPDSIQRFLRLERGKETVIEEKIDSGELLIIRKPARIILIVSDLTGNVAQVVQDNKETIYNLLVQ